MKTCISIIVLSIIPLTLTAQFSFAPVLGIGISNAHVKSKYQIYGTTPINGIRTGVEAGYNIQQHVRVQSGIIYTVNGCVQQADMTIPDKMMRIKTIELPLYIQYKGGKPWHPGFFIAGGGYLGFHTSGSYNDVNRTRSTKFAIGNDSPSVILPFSFGGAFNGGYQSAAGMFIRAGYQFSFTSIASSNTVGKSYYSNQLTIVAGYTIFSSKKKKVKTAEPGK